MSSIYLIVLFGASRARMAHGHCRTAVTFRRYAYGSDATVKFSGVR